MDHYFDTGALFSEQLLAGYQHWVDYCTRQAITAGIAVPRVKYSRRLTLVSLILRDGRQVATVVPDGLRLLLQLPAVEATQSECMMVNLSLMDERWPLMSVLVSIVVK
ncbi:TPA: hypothetical protein ACGE8L_004710 [Yersinia enterocolitica]|nr:hypothetical protein [Yersinia enterocolitica]HEK7317261.1 hypothetical protein [Yersinia enterocolitica]HEN3294868.1 hypothetical protein [Yersinia enterocolitica]